MLESESTASAQASSACRAGDSPGSVSLAAQGTAAATPLGVLGEAVAAGEQRAGQRQEAAGMRLSSEALCPATAPTQGALAVLVTFSLEWG